MEENSTPLLIKLPCDQYVNPRNITSIYVTDRGVVITKTDGMTVNVMTRSAEAAREAGEALARLVGFKELNVQDQSD